MNIFVDTGRKILCLFGKKYRYKKVVFRDGSFGILDRGSYFSAGFIDFKSSGFTWSEDSEFFEDCKTHLESVVDTRLKSLVSKPYKIL